MITTTHSHKHWTDKGGHVTVALLTLPVARLAFHGRPIPSDKSQARVRDPAEIFCCDGQSCSDLNQLPIATSTLLPFHSPCQLM
jgi:hypothetical protein